MPKVSPTEYQELKGFLGYFSERVFDMRGLAPELRPVATLATLEHKFPAKAAAGMNIRGEGDDLFRPSSIDTDDRCVMIQVFPGSHGIHPSRILRYDLRAHRLEVMAECAERDTRGRAEPRGVGGEWELSGITNVSDLLGEDSWLFTVQAHTVEIPQDRRRYGEGGQLLLLRGPRNPRAAIPGAQ